MHVGISWFQVRWCVPVFWRAIPGIMEGPGATLSSSDSATNFQRPRQSSLYNWAGWWWWWWETNRIERKRARNPRLRCNRGIYANRFVCICLTARINGIRPWISRPKRIRILFKPCNEPENWYCKSRSIGFTNRLYLYSNFTKTLSKTELLVGVKEE